MYCRYCRAKIDDGVKFCTECGKKVVLEMPKEKPAKLNAAHYAALVVIVFAIMFCFVSFYLGIFFLGIGIMIFFAGSYNEANGKAASQPKMPNVYELKNAARMNGQAFCPRCGSTSLSGNAKGFGVGKAVIGGSLFGPIGLVAGNINRHKVIVTCLNCGYRFKPKLR